MIFVFGSNLAGIHGAGAALYARIYHGAVIGQGEGMQGTSYALPTCNERIEPMSLEDIKPHVDKFLEFARATPELQFQVTRVGCGLAGHTDAEMAPMFVRAHDNVWLPSAWVRAIAEDVGGKALDTMFPERG